MFKVGLAALLMFASVVVESSEVFLVSEAEHQYQVDVEKAVFEGMLKKGLLERAMSEKGLTLNEASILLRETAKIVSICNVLGMRFYDPVFKVKVGELISEGASQAEVKRGIEKFLDKKIRSGEIDEAMPFEPIISGIEFSKKCMETFKEDPIPTLSPGISTQRIPRGYALDAAEGKIFYNGKIAYQLSDDDHWSFACLYMEGDLKRATGTTMISGIERIFPTSCLYQRSAYYDDAIKFAAWAPPQNGLVSFLLWNGPAGSSAAIEYKAITLSSGQVISKSDSFMAGEYFSASVSEDCTVFLNEYDKSQYLTLAGNCK